MSLTRAVGTISAAGGAPTNGQTVILGAKTFTFQTTLTDADGNVAIGGSAAAAVANLFAAINLGAGAGTAYAAAMTRHPEVTAVTHTPATPSLVVAAPGALGNLVATTGTYIAGVGTATSPLAGGAGNLEVFLEDIFGECQLNSEVWRRLASARVVPV